MSHGRRQPINDGQVVNLCTVRVGADPTLDRAEFGFRRRVEIAAWHHRLAFGCVAQVAFKVPPVLPGERVCFVFRMPLQEYEAASEIFCERVDAMRLRTGQYAIAGFFELALEQTIEARVRNQGRSAFLPDQRMGASGREREDAGALFRQRPSPDPIKMQDGGMSGETRQDRRGGVRLGPIDQLDQFIPIGLVIETIRERLAPVKISAWRLAPRTALAGS